MPGRHLYEQAVPLPTVHAALLLATAPRTLRSSHLMPLQPIRALHYFLPVSEEVMHHPPRPGYVDHLAGKRKPLAGQKAAPRGERLTLGTSVSRYERLNASIEGLRSRSMAVATG